MFLQSGTMTGTFCFMTGTNSLVLVILTGRSPKIISRLAVKSRMLRIHTLFACESGLSEPKIGLKHAFVLLIWQKKQDK
jgi:hypothetical protein